MKLHLKLKKMVLSKLNAYHYPQVIELLYELCKIRKIVIRRGAP